MSAIKTSDMRWRHRRRVRLHNPGEEQPQPQLQHPVWKLSLCSDALNSCQCDKYWHGECVQPCLSISDAGAFLSALAGCGSRFLLHMSPLYAVRERGHHNTLWNELRNVHASGFFISWARVNVNGVVVKKKKEKKESNEAIFSIVLLFLLFL